VKVLKAGRSRLGAVVLRDDENYRLCDMDVYGFLRWRDRRAGLFSHLLMIGPGRLPDSYPFTINNNHSIMPSDAHVIRCLPRRRHRFCLVDAGRGGGED